MGLHRTGLSLRQKFQDKKKFKLILDCVLLSDLLRQSHKDYCEPKKANNFWNNNYIKYESNGDENKNLSIDDYLKKLKPT